MTQPLGLDHLDPGAVLGGAGTHVPDFQPSQGHTVGRHRENLVIPSAVEDRPLGPDDHHPLVDQDGRLAVFTGMNQDSVPVSRRAHRRREGGNRPARIHDDFPGRGEGKDSLYHQADQPGRSSRHQDTRCGPAASRVAPTTGV